MKWTNRNVRRVRNAGRKRSVSPAFDVFEDRLLLSVYTVSTTADNGNDSSPTPGSLRAAIINANTSGGLDTIDFAIPTGDSGYNAGTGVWTLTIAATLPSLTDQVYFDATSQPSYGGAPVIAMDGGSSLVDGLDLASGSDGSTIKGLDITSFTGAAIHIESSNNAIQNNYLGTDPTGTSTGLGNGIGVWVDNVAGNTIGGLTSVGNLISGNTTSGVSITGASATGNLVQGNRIGTNELGTSAIANAVGVIVDGAPNNTIGGTVANRGNTIAFNTGAAVTVSNGGTGDAIRYNSIFRNGSGISLSSGGNAGQAAPTISNVNLIGNSTSLQVSTTGFSAGTILDFYYSASGDTPGGVGQAARFFLGSYTLTAGDILSPTKDLTFATAVPIGQYITATSTSPTSNTSQLASNQVVVNPFIVTTTFDNGDDTSPTPGSLRAAILSANADSSLDTITFSISGLSPFVILPPAALPTIQNPVVIDGTSQSGYSGIPVIQLDGDGNAFDGLSLVSGSGGSTIKGLDFVDFAGAGISVASNSNTIVSNELGIDITATAKPGNAHGIVVTGSNNIIGGIVSGLGNVISANTSAGVVVDTGTGNAIRGNSIYAQTSPISLINGGNANQLSPTLTAATSGGGQTTVQGSLAGFAPNTTYTIDLYSSSTGDPAGTQAHVYLGSFTVLTDGSGNKTFTQSVPAAVAAGLTVTAAATSPSNNTSPLVSPPITVANPFLVTTATDNGDNVSPTPGSLRAAILNANLTSSLDTITFNIGPGSGPFVIALAAALPTISNPVVIDGTTQPGYSGIPTIQLDGGGNAFDGLSLGSGSGGSAIKGLDFVNFAGAGISIASDGNTIVSNNLGIDITATAKPGNTQGIVVTGSNNVIGGIVPGSGNIITANTAAGVVVDTGTGNAIRGNSIFTQPNLIQLQNGGNGGVPAPGIIGVSSSAGQTTVEGTLSGLAANTAYTIDVYASAPGDLSGIQAQIYLGNFQVTTNGSGSASFTKSVTGSVTPSQTVTITATSPTGSTSPFSAASPVLNALVVTTTADNGNDFSPTPGSLRAAILSANATSGLDTISFNLGVGPGPFTIALAAALPTITDPVVIDGSSQFGYSGTPIIVLDGTGGASDGLVLGTGSGGSTLKALDIVHFAGAGIRILTDNNTVQANYIGTDPTGAAAGPGNTLQGIFVSGSNNLIGGTTPNADNVIAFNGGAGITVDTGTGNQIRQNLIFGNSTSVNGIDLTNGGNANQVSPTIQAVTSVTGASTSETTIQFTLTGTVGETIAVDFYDYDPANPGIPQALLGSDSYTLIATTQTFFKVFSVVGTTPPVALTGVVTAVATDTTTFNTSSISNQNAGVTSTYVVNTTTADTDPFVFNAGSLRSAILGANAGGIASRITFDFATATTITIAQALPTITAPVTIIGKTSSGNNQITLAASLPSNSLNGLTIGGVGGVTIQGLVIGGFGNAGIFITSSNNTIGGTAAGAANTFGIVSPTVSNNAVNVSVQSGIGNVIQGNLYNGTIDTSVQDVTDITLAPGANGGIATPSVLGASANLSQITLQVGSATNNVIEIYRLTASQRSFIAEATLTSSGQITIPRGSLNLGDRLIVTATNPSGTSMFSNTVTIASATTVTNTEDSDPNMPAIPGSLRYAIEQANQSGGGSIDFAIPTEGTSSVTIYLNWALPALHTGVSIDGLTQSGIVGYNGPLLVSVTTADPQIANGLILTGNDQINGLAIYGFSNAGILVRSGSNSITNNYLGFDADKTITGLGNKYGIEVGDLDPEFRTFTTHNVIEDNQISANSDAGIYLNIGELNTIRNNLIGTSAFLGINSGTSIIQAGNSGNGITVEASSNNTINGNTIDGNLGYGIEIVDGSTGNQVYDNTIGISQDANGVINGLTVGNISGGIYILNASGNTIGVIPVFPEVVSNRIFGNGVDGIKVEYNSDYTGQGDSDSDNTIENNQIAYNGGNGISLSWAAGNTISRSVTIAGNRIGTNPAGDSTVQTFSADNSVSTEIPVGNGKDGILIQGLKAAISGNVISGNGISGIHVQAGSDGTSITGNMIGTNLDGNSTFDPSKTFRMGNVLDGILLENAGNVSIGGTGVERNVISGNLGRGIEIREGGANTITGNFIGTAKGGQQVTDANNSTQTLGNLGDGIFLLNVSAADIFTGNVISGNRGFGLHAKSSSNLVITGNYIGTNDGGTRARDTSPSAFSFGNNADGIFLDESTGTPTPFSPLRTAALTVNYANGVLITGNVISNNSANGIDLLGSIAVVIQNNKIGTDITGNATGFGNAGNGIFLNNSDGNTIGGLTTNPGQGVGNIISGNLSSGILISGNLQPNTLNDGLADPGNLIEGNLIGLGSAGAALPNSVAGVVISNSNGNVIGGTSSDARNVISGNRLYGVELAAGASQNTIEGNYIGTNINGTGAIGNTSDGVFLIDSPSNTIGGTTTGAGNIISGNFANGVRIFGGGSTANLIAGNTIGLGRDGSTRLSNQSNGVLFDNAAAGNQVGNGTSNGRNVISGNVQSGVMIVDSAGGGGSLIQGNYIGTDSTGTLAKGNGANGVFVYGASNNTIGGYTAQAGTGLGNLISGNIQSGVLLYTPAFAAQANTNAIVGNLIGTSYNGQAAVPNNADGVQIVNGNSNTIRNNVISGNLADGINIAAISDSQTDQLTASWNQVFDNIIGARLDGLGALVGGNQQNGVVIQGASWNTIGSVSGVNLSTTNVPDPGHRSNVISGNKASGVLLNGQSTRNTVQGNYIGVGAYGAAISGLYNGNGVFINNTTTTAGFNTIGGTATGAGNLISGNQANGVEIFGPTTGLAASNSVVGNVIGLQLVNGGASFAAASNIDGINVLNSWGNHIGGAATNEKNFVSGNSHAGIYINGYSGQNTIQGNLIGLDPSGSASILKAGVPIQAYGVLISGAGRNLVGSGGSYSVAGANVISGNGTGVSIANVAAGSSTDSNTVAGNILGLAPGGYLAAPNSEYGVFVENSPYTLVQNNLASANEIAGIGVFGGTASNVLVVNNLVGTNIAGQTAFLTSSTPDYLANLGWQKDIQSGLIPGSQLYGVVIIGASNNVVGAAGAGNLISGNRSVGVYVSRQDFFGNSYAIPVNNLIQNNTITANPQYGILFYNAPSNFAPPFTGPNSQRGARRRVLPGSNANVVLGNGISFLNYLTSVNGRSSLTKNRRTQPAATAKAHAQAQAQAQPKPAAHAKPLRVIMPKQG